MRCLFLGRPFRRASLRAGAGHARRGRCGGFTLLEVMIVIVVMVVSIGMYASSVVTLSNVEPVTRESDVALQAVRNKLSELASVPLDEVLVRFNADPADDPPGALVAPGNTFAVAGMSAQPNDPDGFVGEVIFPLVGTELREDVEDDRLGMPRDLNGDGLIDAVDHGDDFIILPVLVRLQWRGRSGNRAFELASQLSGL